MRLNKLLHPETIMGLRGDPKAIEGYKRFLGNTSYIPGKGYMTDGHLRDNDPILSSHITLCWRFLHDRGKTFHVGRDFCKAIMDIDGEIPIDIMPERFVGYLSFPEGVVHDGENEVLGTYVFVGPANETTLNPSDWDRPDNKMLWLSYVCKGGHTGHLLVPLRAEKLSDILAPLPSTDIRHDPEGKRTIREDSTMQDHPGRRNVFLAALNLILYIHSINCDLVPVPPLKNMKPAQRKEATNRGLLNMSLVPVTFISWQYQTRRVLVDSSWVDTFRRWQRVGPGLSQVKLIWVAPHERKYKRDEQKT